MNDQHTAASWEPKPCKYCDNPVYGHIVDDSHRLCACRDRERREWDKRLEEERAKRPEVFGPDGSLLDPFALGLDCICVSDEEQAARDADDYERGVYFLGVDQHDWNIPRLNGISRSSCNRR